MKRKVAFNLTQLLNSNSREVNKSEEEEMKTLNFNIKNIDKGEMTNEKACGN